jgi:hypothetical protein
MHRQQSGNDAETCAETWNPIHLRFTARPGMSPAGMRHCTRSVSSMIEAWFGFHAAPQDKKWPRYSMPQWLLSA